MSYPIPNWQNPAGSYSLSLTTFWARLAGDGSTVNSDGTPGGALEVYSQYSTTGNDLALVVHGHADIHFSRAAPSNRCQLLTITGAPTGGTFTLSYGGKTTTPLAYNVTPAALKAALLALSSVTGDVYIYSDTGGAPANGGPFTVTMTMPNPTAISLASNNLTGGASPNVTVAQTTPNGMAFFDIPLGGSVPITGQIVGNNGAGGSLVHQLGGAGNGAYYWQNLNGASTLMELLSNGRLLIGSALSLQLLGDAGYPTLIGGGNTAPGLVCYANTGTGLVGKFRFRDNPTDNNDRFHIDTAAPTSGNTVLTLAYHNGTAVVFQPVTLGAADSGGVGFKSLRVPN